MILKILFPILISFILIAIQLVIIPLIAIYGVVPNVVLIYLLFYSLKKGQISGTIFAFFIGLFYDLASGGLIGSGMFAFTIASFISGYFYKDSFVEILKNIKIIILVFLLSSLMFFFFYSVLGNNEVILNNNFGYLMFSLLSAFYTSILALSIYIFSWKKL